MKLLVKDMDIATGGPLIAIINREDAERFDLHATDRILLTKGNKTSIAIVDIGESGRAAPVGKIGLFEEVIDALHAKDGDEVHLKIADKPIALKHIRKKLDGHPLNEKETYEIIKDIVDGKLIDIELTYYVTANYIWGMSLKEIVHLTKSMIHTGDQLHFGNRMVVDKHCIGGVPGNRSTLAVIPILIAGGLCVPKTSSRAITSPAGTADTMEVLCNVCLNSSELKRTVAKIGGCMVWGGAINLAPADDVIINVEHPLSIDAEGQLIASIMAKKGSVGSTHVLIDIPIGTGAKIGSHHQARRLKRLFEIVGREIGIKVFVVLTDGRQPIGNGIGPALEARDVMWMLSNHPNQPLDLRKKCVTMAGYIFEMTGRTRTGEGKKLAEKLLSTGAAYKKMWDIINAQGANIKKIDDIEIGRFSHDILAPRSGIVRHIDNTIIAKIARLAGCPKDKRSGLYLYKHVGDQVAKGEKLFTIYTQSKERLVYAKNHDGFSAVKIR
ncbi:MAG: AMP phosphorylase [Candidatus Woesearchaeota archaeon]|nr:AMP phosphorylase [Candidatus Woesearchaeota archaeon]